MRVQHARTMSIRMQDAWKWMLKAFANFDFFPSTSRDISVDQCNASTSKIWSLWEYSVRCMTLRRWLITDFCLRLQFSRNERITDLFFGHPKRHKSFNKLFRLTFCSARIITTQSWLNTKFLFVAQRLIDFFSSPILKFPTIKFLPHEAVDRFGVTNWIKNRTIFLPYNETIFR